LCSTSLNFRNGGTVTTGCISIPWWVFQGSKILCRTGRLPRQRLPGAGEASLLRLGRDTSEYPAASLKRAMPSCYGDAQGCDSGGAEKSWVADLTGSGTTRRPTRAACSPSPKCVSAYFHTRQKPCTASTASGDASGSPLKKRWCTSMVSTASTCVAFSVLCIGTGDSRDKWRVPKHVGCMNFVGNTKASKCRCPNHGRRQTEARPGPSRPRGGQREDPGWPPPFRPEGGARRACADRFQSRRRPDLHRRQGIVAAPCPRHRVSRIPPAHVWIATVRSPLGFGEATASIRDAEG